MKNSKNTKKKKSGIGKKILIILLLVILVAGCIFGYKVYKNGGGTRGFLATLVGHDENTLKNLPKIYTLLLGQSEGPTDTIMIAEYDPQNQQASLLSIPRDTFVGDNKAKARPEDKINAVYSMGGHKSAMKEINELTGLNIQYYIKVDTEAFKFLVDAIGGVTFNVPIDMKYDDGKQNLHIDLKAGEQLLDGNKAEQLVRFRHNNDGTTYSYEYGMEDLGRIRTQRAFLAALAKQTLKPSNIFKINQFVEIAQQYVETNLSFDVIKDYVPYIVDFNANNLRTEQLPGQSEKANGWWIFAPDEVKTAKMIEDLFLNPIPDEDIDTSSIDMTGIDRSKIKIELINGSHSTTKLERIKSRLEKKGYTISKTSETTDTENTVIINRGNVEQKVIEELKLLTDTKTVSTGTSTSNQITIIIGKKD